MTYLLLFLLAGAEAPSETWWSLRPLVRPPVPKVKRHDWTRSPVDAFLLAALEAKGLNPSPEADRLTLLRRLSFDLIGLPPTVEEQDAFLNDKRPDAYERLVDRLLASPAYGERWGRHWLDVARYADTHGYDKDKRRDQAWRYRDWVIAALNEGKPYRDFVREQLAGDVLKPGTADGLIAVGYIAAGPWDFVGQVELREGTVDKLKTRVLDRDDMVSSTMGAFASLTAGCARCHDHKFDPISQKDYYSLQAVFAGVERGNRRLPGGEDAVHSRQIDKARADLAGIDREIAKLQGPKLTKLDEALKQARADLAKIVVPKTGRSPSNGYHSAIVARADVVKWVQIDLGAVLPLDEIRLFPARPVDFRDAPGFGFPSRFKVEISDEPTFKKPVMVLDKTRESEPNPGDVPQIINAAGRKGRHVRITATRLWKRTDDYIFALGEVQVISGAKEVSRGKPVTSLDTIEAGRWSRRYLVDGSDSREVLPDLSRTEIRKAFLSRRVLQEKITGLESEHGAAMARLVPAALRAKRETLRKSLTDLEAKSRKGPEVYGVVSIAPRTIHLLRRGDVESPKGVMEPRGLACAGIEADFKITSPAEGARRLALADWLTDSRHPLTWRSIVNRVWHHHFGRGIVDTPNDFGKMGSKPTHPELLDWLAVEFRDGGGSLKSLHRLLVTSTAYRQESRHDGKAARLDSDNRLLWRMTCRRLDAESLRDAVLATSGRLNRRMGEQGYDLFRFKDDHSPVYDHSSLERIHDPATYRRTVYRFTVRSVPNPFLDCLDCADPNQPVPTRNTTLTALQALALLNNPFMVRQASYFARRLEGRGTLSEKIDEAHRLAFGRPADAEMKRALLDHAEKHGLAATCRVLFNANEFLFID